MKRDAAMKLASEVRDLQIVDCDGRNCGICDDIEFAGGAGEALEVKALLVGPGAYSGRLPRWAFTLVKWVAGTHMMRVPWEKVDKVTARIYLTECGEGLGLHRVEDRLCKRLSKVPSVS
jgi:sporulation protein YlmC with PRC-barrel domain